MASGMAGQTSCLNSRWDQPGPTADMLKGLLGNISTSLTTQVASLPSYTGGCLASGATNGLPLAGGTGSTAPPATSHPTPTSPEEEKPSGGVEMAAAMAAKINAMLMAKGKLKTPPPLHSKVAPRVTVASTASELVVTEVDINDVPINCRNLLTKGKTQEEIRQYSGAVVSTKGHYMTSAEKAQSKGGDRPLYLHVQGKSQEEVNKAVKHIKEIISEDILRSSAGQSRPVMPPLPVYTQPSAQPSVPPPVRPPVQPHHMPSPPPQNQKSPASYNSHSGNFVHTKVFVGLDQALPSFNVNEKVEGPGGSYLQHIQAETGARVFLRGKGSGYIEQASRRESFEPLYLYISHPNSAGLEAARKLCESLVETVRAEHSRQVSVYTATGSTQAYPSHGYPANNNYGSHVSWYNYPANSYTGGYAAYPGSSGYWSSANGAPGHSNFSTTPQSSQAMVQYPVCPRKPPSYLAPDTGTSYSRGTEGCSSSPPRAASPKRRFLEGAEEACESQHGSASAAVLRKEQHAPLPTADTEDGEASQRTLMPPPPIPVGLAPRKRPREVESQPSTPDPKDKVEPDSLKKARPLEGAPGLVPYGGDSSDEEDDRTRSSKKS